MNGIINAQLTALEQSENIKILMAVESGSRAWGFSSAESDYDVRFIYIRPKEFYLRLDQTRDVIEKPISDRLDVSGWDLKKALPLLRGSNPSLYEWFASPVVYREPCFMSDFHSLLKTCFLPKTCVNHYLNAAIRHENTYFTEPTVRAKKYLHTLRPLLACRWIIERGTPPPIPFTELADACLADEMKPYVNRLLDMKINTPEIKTIERIEPLHAYIESGIHEIRAAIRNMPDDQPASWEMLNSVFLTELGL
ncbi:MAG: nucleotidyltransferase domain-containing protein [Clostridia bacterium]|nr:nucleotidyltransferase domain-containing protein [Clostridia bacterium]